MQNGILKFLLLSIILIYDGFYFLEKITFLNYKISSDRTNCRVASDGGDRRDCEMERIMFTKKCTYAHAHKGRVVNIFYHFFNAGKGVLKFKVLNSIFILLNSHCC